MQGEQSSALGRWPLWFWLGVVMAGAAACLRGVSFETGRVFVA